MTIPNNENFWHQKELNAKYGFRQFFALGTEDNKLWCQDDEIFKNVIIEQQHLQQPFFHVVLTLSMHGSYKGNPSFNSKIDAFHFPVNYSPEYCNYLKKCNYTDEQIGKYLDYLRNTNRYSNTVIVISSDHEVDLNMPKEKMNDYDLPLLIINSGVDNKFFSQSRCNQVDLFPTLIDLMGVESYWRGVGHSLMRKCDSFMLTDKEEYISAKILQGNYFGKYFNER